MTSDDGLPRLLTYRVAPPMSCIASDGVVRVVLMPGNGEIDERYVLPALEGVDIHDLIDGGDDGVPVDPIKWIDRYLLGQVMPARREPRDDRGEASRCEVTEEAAPSAQQRSYGRTVLDARDRRLARKRRPR